MHELRDATYPTNVSLTIGVRFSMIAAFGRSGLLEFITHQFIVERAVGTQSSLLEWPLEANPDIERGVERCASLDFDLTGTDVVGERATMGLRATTLAARIDLAAVRKFPGAETVEKGRRGRSAAAF